MRPVGSSTRRPPSNAAHPASARDSQRSCTGHSPTRALARVQDIPTPWLTNRSSGQNMPPANSSGQPLRRARKVASAPHVPQGTSPPSISRPARPATDQSATGPAEPEGTAADRAVTAGAGGSPDGARAGGVTGAGGASAPAT